MAADSYMGMFLPADISYRIMQFMAAKIEFPFVSKDEIIAAFYLFGKDHGVKGNDEIMAATDMAKKTVEQVARDIRVYTNMPGKLDPGFARENYTKRSLQIVVECQNSNPSEINKRVAGDPAILSDCFAQHIAHYRQNYFFELFQPFAKDQLPSFLHDKLEGRMLLLGFNTQDSKSLPFASPLEPFFRWLKV